MYRNVRKDANLRVFPMACGSGGSTSRLAKAAGAEPCGRGERKNCTPLWREAHFQVKRYRDVEEWYAAVARSAFSSQNVKNKN